MIQYAVREFLKDGLSPFGGWFNNLNAIAAGKITAALYRLEHGNFSNVEPVGEGVSEYKIDFGPGYRIYFGQDGKTLIILLFGGNKKTQKKDIDKAKELWREYKTRKQIGG
jgi:putative addiction module killer protein